MPAGLPIDLRSDTVTRPTPGMREAMARAEVGDDVFGDDPSVLALEERAADLLGKEAALLLPSGTQSNLCAVMAHCGRGEEVITGDAYHVFVAEAGGAAVLGSVVSCPLPTEADGSLDPRRIAAAVKPDDPHHPISRLLSLENTFSGQVIDSGRIASAAETAHSHGLSVHLDGARIMNAAIALGVTPAEAAASADTISVCLSKGLGTPAGTVLCGPRDLISYARRIRKMLGGAMRQSGVIAACGLYAFEHHIDRLAEDHRRAKALATRLQDIPQLSVELGMVQTNMLFLDVEDRHIEPLAKSLREAGILIAAYPGSPRIRVVTHLDISDFDVDATIDAIHEFYDRRN